MNQVTSASIRYPLSVFNKNTTLKQHTHVILAEIGWEIGLDKIMVQNESFWSIFGVRHIAVLLRNGGRDNEAGKMNV